MSALLTVINSEGCVDLVVLHVECAQTASRPRDHSCTLLEEPRRVGLLRCLLVTFLVTIFLYWM